MESNPSPQERDNMFLVHMATVMDGAVKKWQCILCGKMAKLKGDILDHVECKHRDNAFLYSCRYCTKVVNTNRKLRIHEVNSYNCVPGTKRFLNLNEFVVCLMFSTIMMVQNYSYYPFEYQHRCNEKHVM